MTSESRRRHALFDEDSAVNRYRRGLRSRNKLRGYFARLAYERYHGGRSEIRYRPDSSTNPTIRKLPPQEYKLAAAGSGKGVRAVFEADRNNGSLKTSVNSKVSLAISPRSDSTPSSELTLRLEINPFIPIGSECQVLLIDNEIIPLLEEYGSLPRGDSAIDGPEWIRQILSSKEMNEVGPLARCVGSLPDIRFRADHVAMLKFKVPVSIENAPPLPEDTTLVAVIERCDSAENSDA